MFDYACSDPKLAQVLLEMIILSVDMKEQGTHLHFSY